MKRSQMYKKVNKRNNIFNHLNRNVVYPSLFLNSDDLNKQSSVEIIELKSDEEPEKVGDKSNYSHVWCYESDEQESSYRINKEARERRRIEKDHDEMYNELFERMCSNYYGIDCHNYHDGSANSHEPKCFTIINNISYETSSDDDIEEELSDIILNGDGVTSFDDHNYNNGYTEKRTVCIYSEKNKELSDELKNISYRDSTSSSTDNEDSIIDINHSYIRKLATPIPTYVPKLFIPLSPTLPTVTEVLESYNKSSSNTEINRSKSMTPQMPINNWVQEEESDLEHTGDNDHKWNALSPREKRRIKNSMNIDKIGQESVIVNPKTTDVDIIENETEPQTNELKKSIDSENSMNEINNLQKPQIKIDRKKLHDIETITEPLEKENGKWIGDEIDEIFNVFDYDLEQNDAKDTSDVIHESNKVNNFLVTNMSLLKPAEWNQYLPITGSIPSLNLSFESEDNRSCLLSLFKCFKCCKRYK